MRLFVAHRIGPTQSEKIAATVAVLRKHLPRASWVASHDFHLTFAFLGEQDQGVVERLSASLQRHLAGLHRIGSALEHGGFFPERGRPRVGWIAIHPPEALTDMASRVRVALHESHIAFDEKAFKPHLTIVRLREPWGLRDADMFRNAIDGLGAIPLEVDRVSLFDSRLLPSGAVHTELAAVPLR